MRFSQRAVDKYAVCISVARFIFCWQRLKRMARANLMGVSNHYHNLRGIYSMLLSMLVELHFQQVHA